MDKAIEHINNNKLLYKTLTSIIIIIIVIKLLINYRRYRKQNPVFLSRGHDCRKPFKIDDFYIVKLDTYTYSYFLYIDDWDYNIKDIKVILAKSNETFSDFSFICGLTPIVNNLFLSIKLIDLTNEIHYISNLPIKKWIHLTFVFNEKFVEIYINGKLSKSIILKNKIKNNSYPLYIAPLKGFGGFIKNLKYNNRVLTNKEIYENGRKPLFNYDFIWSNIKVKNIDICGDDYNSELLDIFDVEQDKNSILALNNLYNLSSDSLIGVSRNYIEQVRSTANLLDNRTKKIKQSDDCPLENRAPYCPIGTLACENNNKYCYYPNDNIMVSTYIDTNKDFCPNNNKIGKIDGNDPIKIGDINVWKRKDGIDTTCKNLAKLSKN